MKSKPILACALLAVLQGCSSVGTTTTPSPSESPIASSTAPSSAPSPTGGMDVPSDAPMDATALQLISRAKEHLATMLAVTPGEIELSAFQEVQWRDAGLGCPKPGVDYIPMPTPGYRISLKAGGATYDYHSDRGARVILCKSGQASSWIRPGRGTS